MQCLAEIRVNYINNIIRNNADFIYLTLQHKKNINNHQMSERNIEFYMQSLKREIHI